MEIEFKDANVEKVFNFIIDNIPEYSREDTVYAISDMFYLMRHVEFHKKESNNMLLEEVVAKAVSETPVPTRRYTGTSCMEL